MINFKNPLFVVLLSFGITSPAIGQPDKTEDQSYQTNIEEARKYIDSLKSALKIPGLSVAVGIRGKLVWSEALGLADINANTTVTPETKFRVGSISKTMTAFALGKLYDEGKLDFDDEVGKYIPQFTQKDYPVTIRQVAGHQGGIRHYRGFEFLSNKQYNSVEESLSIFAEDKLEFEPGTKYSYSTYGYVTLSRIIERIAEKDYLNYMDQEVFKPLAMSHTVAENAGRIESTKATFYAKNGKREAGKVNLSSKWAGGGFLSTPTDLVNMVNYATKIISPQTLFTLVKPQLLKDGTPTDYGIGWRNTVTKDKRVLVHHGGSSSGARAFLMVLLNEQIVVAVCANSEADYNAKEVYRLARFFLP